MANNILSRRHFLASLAAFGAVPFLPPPSVPMNAVEGAIYSPITPGDTWRFVTEVYWESTPIRWDGAQWKGNR